MGLRGAAHKFNGCASSRARALGIGTASEVWSPESSSTGRSTGGGFCWLGLQWRYCGNGLF